MKHRKGLERAPGSGLKIMMDAREMKFLDNTFDSAAAFCTLMYIENKDHRKVFSEIHRVLKPGGECLIWDMVIPEPGTNGVIYPKVPGLLHISTFLEFHIIM